MSLIARIEAIKIVIISITMVQIFIFSIIPLTIAQTVTIKFIIFDYSGNVPLIENGIKPKIVLRNLVTGINYEYEATNNGTHTLCEIANLPSGNYEVKISWKEVNVYLDENLTINVNETIIIKCNVSLIKIKVVDKLQNPITNAEIGLLRQESPTIFELLPTDEEGYITSLLPFGTYAITSSRMNVSNCEIEVNAAQDMIRIDETGVSIMTANGEIFNNLILDVYPLCIKILHGKGGLLSPRALGNINLRIMKNEKILFNISMKDYLNSSICIRQLPLGEYTILVYWKNYCFDTRTINHYTLSEIPIRINLSNLVIIDFVDEAGSPIANANITFSFPWGENVTYTTNELGRITLYDIPYGVYSAKIQVKGYSPIKLYIEINSTSYYKYIIEELFTVTIYFERNSKRDVRLPEGVIAEVYLNDKIVRNTTLSIDRPYITLRNIPNSTLKIRLLWQGVQVGFFEKIITKSEEIKVKCDIFRLNFKVLDLDYKVVKNCEVYLKHPNGTIIRGFSDDNGYVYWKYLPKGEYRVLILWKGVYVFNSSFELFEDIEGRVVRIYVKSFSVKIFDLLNQQVPNLSLRLIPVVLKEGKIIKRLNYNVTPSIISHGAYVFEQVPFITDTFKFLGKWNNKLIIDDLIKIEEAAKEVVLKYSILNVFNSYILTFQEIITIIAIIVIVIAGIIIFIKLYKRFEIKGIIVEAVRFKKEEKKEKPKIEIIEREEKLPGELRGKISEKIRKAFRLPVTSEERKAEEVEEHGEEYEEFELFEE